MAARGANAASRSMMTSSIWRSTRSSNIVIIGGGAAGMAAALEASSNHSGDIYLLESTSKIGGNSAKASSGMNGCCTSIQEEQGVMDSTDMFRDDTLRTGKDMADPSLIDKLVNESSSAVSFVCNLGLPLRDVIQLGGHSCARTHRVQGLPIGAALMKTLSAEASQRQNIRIVTEAAVHRLLFEDFVDGENGKEKRQVTGVVYIKPSIDGEEEVEVELDAGAVILTTGGAACDVEADGLMQKYAPDVMGMATSSGAQATGKGIKIAQAIGVDLVNMHRVQLHPTGFIDPSCPSSPSKFLAPEALRGNGGILINQEGNRFANELGSRSYVTDCIHQNCVPHNEDLKTGRKQVMAYLLLTKEAAEKFGTGPMGFYLHKGLFQEFNTIEAACTSHGIPWEKVKGTLQDYDAAAAGNIEDSFGKVTFPVSMNASGDEQVYIAQVTPVIHYSLGGIKIDDKCRAMLMNADRPLYGLYAAGECTGGVHGFDRLGGNSLLECIVFGRTAGFEAALFVNS